MLSQQQKDGMLDMSIRDALIRADHVIDIWADAVDSYRVYRNCWPPPSFDAPTDIIHEMIAEVDADEAPAHVDTDVIVGETYGYYVTAVLFRGGFRLIDNLCEAILKNSVRAPYDGAAWRVVIRYEHPVSHFNDDFIPLRLWLIQGVIYRGDSF